MRFLRDGFGASADFVVDVIKVNKYFIILSDKRKSDLNCTLGVIYIFKIPMISSDLSSKW